MKSLTLIGVITGVILALIFLAKTPETPEVAPPSKDLADGSTAHIRAITKAVDSQRIQANGKQGSDWLSYGLDYAETRFSPLKLIDASNVNRLGLTSSIEIGSVRGLEATPLVVDGIMYVTAPWSVVYALNIRTGTKLWTYDPKVPKAYGVNACCGVVNRGVALYQGSVFVGSLDGRLIALDAATGELRWQVNTIGEEGKPYTITGAPRVFDGTVLIGNGGAEYGVRGYVTAYDAATGEQKWRWYTVPGDPDQPYENDAMRQAASTWDPSGRYWEVGGGGTVWDSIVYDPELKLIYLGVGNGSPWSHKLRSPGGGDNLFLASIVALDWETGEYVWHYQETPADNWDYTSTQSIILSDLEIDGQLRKVLLHAPKNGFFFVVDRSNGQFISAQNFVDVNWATGYDAQGRPIEVAASRGSESFDSVPGPNGAHNWHPMSYNTDLGLAYIPAQNLPLNLTEDPDWEYQQNKLGDLASGTGWNIGFTVNKQPPSSEPFGRLIAWDPVAQKEVWHVDHATARNGGTLTTAGNLVFQGTGNGQFLAFDARTGETLWSINLGGGIIAAPITYQMDGKQYLSIAAGWGGASGQSSRATDYRNPGRVYTFALGADSEFPENIPYQSDPLLSGIDYDPALVPQGTLLYVSNCAICHGIPGKNTGGSIRNLGYINKAVIEQLDTLVLNGAFIPRGMPDFSGKLSAEELTMIKAFILNTANAFAPQSATE